MPEALSAILFLGERSPYGLSVAKALLDSRLRPRLVILPSQAVYERAAARASAASGRNAAATGLLHRAIAVTRRMMRPTLAPEEEAGEPIPPLDLAGDLTPASLAELYRSARVPWRQVSEIRSPEFLASLRQASPALLLCAAFPLIFTQELLSIPASGSVNFHPSLLPRCRGCHPIYWTLASGETQGGVTAHFMTREVDAGNIVAQIALPLTDQDDYLSLYRRAMQASRSLVAQVEGFFLSGGGPGIPQDRSRATYFHEDTEEDHLVRWSGQSPREIVALARTGEAFTYVRGERLGILTAVEPVLMRRERRLSRPGSVISVSGETLIVAASGGPVALRTLAWRGLRYQAAELAGSLGLKRGEVLG